MVGSWGEEPASKYVRWWEGTLDSVGGGGMTGATSCNVSLELEGCVEWKLLKDRRASNVMVIRSGFEDGALR
jgi:hypothetical protein